jgi:hypothetical protein
MVAGCCPCRTALKVLPPYWLPTSLPVPLFGRQDALKSLKADADTLPKHKDTPAELVAAFGRRSLSMDDMTVLTGER